MRSAVIIIACGLLGFGCVSVALADPPVLPVDPLTDPAAAFDSFRALYKIGWPVTIIAGVAVLARLLGRFVPRFAVLAGNCLLYTSDAADE